MTDISSREAERLRTEVSGAVLGPADPDYDEVRRIHNGLIDKHPALIARCTNSADVSAAVRFGRDMGVEISVRGGGHNVAGKAVTEGGLMIDLSLMKEISVDAAARTVAAGGGVTWGEFNLAAHEAGLATTGGVVSTTGIAGLTLGGGVGWTMGRYALAVDNLLGAEVVLASGDVVTVDEESDADLLWALKGGGGNFGVATSLRYRAYPLETVLGGLVAHPIAAAPDVLRFYREFTATAPDDLTVFAALQHAPDGTAVCGLALCHAGDDAARADADVKSLRQFGPPAIDLVDRVPYPVVNTLIDGNFPRGALNYWKSAFFTDLDDGAAATMIAACENAPSPMCSLVVEHLHGEATRIAPTATAFPHRAAGYNCIIISEWVDPADTDAGIKWARDTFDALRPHMADSVYVNYLGDDDANRVQAAYGPNYERLVALKRRYDPDNLFRLNQNIAP